MSDSFFTSLFICSAYARNPGGNASREIVANGSFFFSLLVFLSSSANIISANLAGIIVTPFTDLPSFSASFLETNWSSTMPGSEINPAGRTGQLLGSRVEIGTSSITDFSQASIQISIC